MDNYQIWYTKPEWTRSGLLGEKPDPENLDETHVLLKSIAHQAKGGQSNMDALEDIYLAMQGENWSPNGEARPLIREKGLDHTSMSVGDVIIDPDGVTFLVSTFGFREMTKRTEADVQMADNGTSP